MVLKKLIAVALSAVMAGSLAVSSATATVTNESKSGAYYNSSDSYATYSGNDLGFTYSPQSTTFKVWAPLASNAKVNLYATGSDSEEGAKNLGTHSMKKDSSNNVWSVTVQGDLKNIYYTYSITNNGTTRETQDVYSLATGVNGNRSMIVDLDSTDPEGWDTDKHVLFNNAQEAVVWEVHVRDFSIDDSSGVSSENKGKYLAFTEGGTKLNSDTSEDAISTGIDYLVKSGINCVQLMPVYDFVSVDETVTGDPTNRNWGYDPMNYNVPEGSYSTNPYNGNTRITEFKQMIQALHDRGISVVMDVVYNHTYSTEDSCFHKTVPGYYFRQTSSSVYSNGAGCGNETASDKQMYRKYMIDSVLYWAKEYHIDGFRFDLMGIHDITTMNEIRNKLDNLYSDGSGQKILMYG
ncbi:MAG: alpha-amylase family glycosyl hydrolase, partial [Acutalibacteraceae bacterium]|nr:alpha-amylase family glycosyl hydrolase [Acutalibacteraceae bacterium]